MPAMSFGAGPAKGLGFTGSSVPESRKFPAGTVIPYNGSNYQGSALPYSDEELSAMGWRRFSEANDCCLYAYTPSTLASYSNLGRVDPQINFSIDISGTTASAGAHTGTNITQAAYLTTGSLYANNVSSGAHTHSVSGYASSAQSAVITKNQRTFIIATRSQPSIPAYSIVSKENGFPISNSTPVYGGAVATPGGPQVAGIGSFLVASDTNVGRVVKTADINVAVTPTLGISGSHNHSGASRKTQLPAGQRFYAYYVGDYSGEHTHIMGDWTAVQTKIASKLIDFYMVFNDTVPEKDLIVMYVNTVPPPSNWTFVSSIGNNIIGMENGSLFGIGGMPSTWGKIIAHDARLLSSGTIATTYPVHSHNNAGYSPANLASTSYSGIVTNAQHSSYGLNHTHANGTAVASIQPFIPKKIWVGFIKCTGTS